MKNPVKKNGPLLLIVLLVAAFVAVAWLAEDTSQNRPDFTSFSGGEYGISLLFDTLQHMGYPVRHLHRATASVSVNDVVFVTQPNHALVDGEEMLNWLRRGGRMFLFDNRRVNVLSEYLEPLSYMRRDGLRIYRIGRGYVAAGAADAIVNTNLMHNPAVGANIAVFLHYWRPENIWFAETYHGFGVTESAFGQFPLWLRLTALQIILAAALAVWHRGKRFGAPVPLYEETDREEHEQVYTLARLYRWADRKNKL